MIRSHWPSRRRADLRRTPVQGIPVTNDYIPYRYVYLEGLPRERERPRGREGEGEARK
jgi:hypothetical protein